VTVIRGVSAATSLKSKFMKTKEHHVFLGGVDCYDVWPLSTNQLCDFCVLLCCSEIMTGKALASVNQGCTTSDRR